MGIDRPTDQRTESATYRVAYSQLKTSGLSGSLCSSYLRSSKCEGLSPLVSCLYLYLSIATRCSISISVSISNSLTLSLTLYRNLPLYFCFSIPCFLSSPFCQHSRPTVRPYWHSGSFRWFEMREYRFSNIYGQAMKNSRFGFCVCVPF